jgi:hypothetical protein
MREGHAGFIKRVSEKARKSFPQISPPGQTGVALCLAGSKSSSQLFHNLLTIDFLVTPSKSYQVTLILRPVWSLDQNRPPIKT